MTVFIPGIGGFIGSHLAESLIMGNNYRVLGLDKEVAKLGGLLKHPNLEVVQGDIIASWKAVEEYVKRADVVVPLLALPVPASYVRNPVATFDLTFLHNLRVVELCVKHSTRLIFLSSSEVYGMCGQDQLVEDKAPLVLGPTQRLRWIYACCKGLLERVILAYGQEYALRFTIVRPFNWIGPRLDNLGSDVIQFPRVLVQFIRNMINDEPLLLLDGGSQRRCFLYISDGVDLLTRLIEKTDKSCDGEVINVGAPSNEVSISDLADMLLALYRERRPTQSCVRKVPSESVHGAGYQDTQFRRPSIDKAKELLAWRPTVGLQPALEMTLDHYLEEWERRRP